MGVLPRILKSKALCVYFQMYSPLDHGMLSEALLQAGVELIAETGLKRSLATLADRNSGANTALEQPLLESTRFSLNGVSKVRAYSETLSTVLEGLMCVSAPNVGLHLLCRCESVVYVAASIVA